MGRSPAKVYHLDLVSSKDVVEGGVKATCRQSMDIVEMTDTQLARSVRAASVERQTRCHKADERWFSLATTSSSANST